MDGISAHSPARLASTAPLSPASLRARQVAGRGRIRLPALALLGLLCAACTTPPRAPERPEAPPLAAHWRNALPDRQADVPTPTWWAAFGDPGLGRVVDLALHDSPDMAMAVARLRQAEAQARQAHAGLFPSFDARVDAAQARSALTEGGTETYTSRSLGLQTQYELDLWRRLSSLSEVATATARASAFDRDAVALSLSAATAAAWLDTSVLQARALLADESLERARHILRLVTARRDAGAASPLDVARQQTLTSAQERLAAELRQRTEETRTRLAVLTGRTPGELDLTLPDPAGLMPPAIHHGLPAGLLTRRPDIARAEAQLAAANANVAAARAAMLPRVSLSASLTSTFAPVSAPLYSLAGGLLAPIFDAGRLEARREETMAVREALLASYRATILNAVGEVERSMATLAGIEAQHTAQTRELEAARLSMRLAEARYRAGAENLQALLDAQRSTFTALDIRLQLHQARLQGSVDLYKALGGGWQATSP
ncbi:MAG: efflux transporter outer membrane subunit [Proteobacteria bacterium]|nr:efflux transporter outer membrane subunit [Pseudomonadota bacterium]